jgi:methyl-accepting chemotaxis protein
MRRFARFSFRSLGLRHAFAVRIACFLLVMAAAASIGVLSMGKAQASLHDMYASELSTASVVGRVMNYYESSMGEVQESLQMKLPSRTETAVSTLAANQSLIARMWREYLAVAAGMPASDEMQLFASHKEAMDKYFGKIASSLKDEKYDEAIGTRDDLLQSMYVTLQSDAANLLGKVAETGSARYAAVSAEVARARWSMLGTLGGGLVVALILDIWLLRRVLVELGAASRLAVDITQGKLGHEPKEHTRDELGVLARSLADMDGKLSEIVRDMGEGATTLRIASARITVGSDELAGRTQSQAAALEQSNAQIGQLASAASRHADTARTVDLEVRGVRERADHGSQVLTRTIAAMDEIHADSGRVAVIVGVIDEIAFQTNLLALNAAVEAARAGEHGRGFAVVASEVRRLSQRCSSSAREIKELVGESGERVRAGAKLATESGAALAGIAQGVQRVAGHIASMARDSQEQSMAFEQIHAAFDEMNDITQKNTELVDDMASACRLLQRQADALGTQVNYFQIDDAGWDEAMDERSSALSKG